MIEVQCPITGEQTHWPDRKAHMVPTLLELSEAFEVAIEDIWIMVKIAAEKGEEWLPDSLEYWDLIVGITNDTQMLKLARQGEITLSIMELLAIRARARRGIELELEHERKPKRRAKLKAMLREIDAARAYSAHLATQMLERMRKVN
jgi:hypothetical protein